MIKAILNVVAQWDNRKQKHNPLWIKAVYDLYESLSHVMALFASSSIMIAAFLGFFIGEDDPLIPYLITFAIFSLIGVALVLHKADSIKARNRALFKRMN